MPIDRPLTTQEIDDGWTLDADPAVDDAEPYYLEYSVTLGSPDKAPPRFRKGKPAKRFKKRRGKRSRAG